MTIAQRIRESLEHFGRNDHGGLPMQMALIFGIGGIAAAILLTPVLQDATEQYASQEGFGVDRTVTGSVAMRPNRYTIRNSVLSKEPEIICGRAPVPACPSR